MQKKIEKTESTWVPYQEINNSYTESPRKLYIVSPYCIT